MLYENYGIENVKIFVFVIYVFVYFVFFDCEWKLCIWGDIIVMIMLYEMVE